MSARTGGRGYRSTDDPSFRKIDPVGVVPVIDDGAPRLRETNTIVRYLAAKQDRADLYPTDLEGRARSQSWMDWASTNCANGMRPVFHGCIVENPAYVNGVAVGIKDWSAQMRVRLLGAAGPHVMGAHFTILVGRIVNRRFAINFEKPEFKAVSACYDRLTERPAYRLHGRNGTP
jgi:glutathione S-transferase